MSPQPHLRGCVAYREETPFAVVLLCVPLVHRWSAPCSLIYCTQPEREQCEMGCVAEDCRGDDFFPFTNKLYGRSFYLSSPQLPPHYNKSNLDH